MVFYCLQAFDCIPQDLLNAKLSGYGFDKTALKYIYLKKRQRCVRINNIYSGFEEIISGVPQGSIVGPILFNAFLNDFFYDIENASVHNFADDNTLSCFAKTVKDLINVLKEESEVAINWFSSNKMIVNPDKFKSVILTKNKSDDVPTGLSIGTDIVSIEKSVKLLGIHLDNRLNFNLHINTICKSASNQLNALVRLKKFLSFEQKKVLVNSFILSNFDYCPLVWFISSAKSLNKVENLQKRALRFLQNDYHSSYETLLHKSGKTTVNVRNLRNLCKEIFKSLNNLNPVFLKEIFYFKESNRPVREKYKLNLQIPKINQVRFGTKSLRGLGPKIWNTLPYHIKTSENIDIFKKTIKNWNGVECKCLVCQKST